MVIKFANGDINKGENPKLQKIIIHGHYDKRQTIDELESVNAEAKLSENHPDFKIKYEKHCDGWRGIMTFTETTTNNNEEQEQETILLQNIANRINQEQAAEQEEIHRLDNRRRRRRTTTTTTTTTTRTT